MSLLIRSLICVSIHLGGCTPSEHNAPPPTTSSAQEYSPEIKSDDSALSSFPWPSLSDFEPLVQDHLQKTREQLSHAVESEAMALELATQYGTAAMVYHAYTLREAARIAYQRAETLNPNDPRWPYLRGHVVRVGDRVADAIPAFLRALELEPELVAGWVALGEILFELNRNQESAEAFQQAIAYDPLCAAAHGGIGRNSLEAKDFSAAVDSLEIAIEIAPHASSFRYPLGLAYRGLGDSKRAIEEMEQRGMINAAPVDRYLQVVRELPAGWRVHLRRGTTFFQEGRYPQALREFELAASAAPEVATVRLNLGSALVKVGRKKESVEHFQTAADLNPTAALPWFNLGVLAGGRGDDRLAVDYYRKATEADPGLLDAHFNRANALRRLSRFEEATLAYRIVVDSEPGRSAAHLGEALSLVRLGESIAAIERLQQAIRLIPGDGPLRNALARLLATKSDSIGKAQAVQLANQLLREESTLEHVETAAIAYAAVGNFALACELLDKAIQAAQSSGHPELVSDLQRRREHFQRSTPPEEPWPLESPILSPPPLGSDSPSVPSGSVSPTD